MSTTGKIIVAALVVSVSLVIFDVFYFSDFQKKVLSIPFITNQSLTPTSSPLLAVTPTDRIIWHDMSDVKTSNFDLNTLNKGLVENWLASPSANPSIIIDYRDSPTSIPVKLFPGKFKKLVANSISIFQGQKELNYSYVSDNNSRLWKKTPNKLYVASPSLDQIVKYNLVSLGLNPDDLVLVYQVKDINRTQQSNSLGVWLVVFTQN